MHRICHIGSHIGITETGKKVTHKIPQPMTSRVKSMGSAPLAGSLRSLNQDMTRWPKLCMWTGVVAHAAWLHALAHAREAKTKKLYLQR